MSWFPVDDALHAHPKARKAGFEALGLWTVSGSYCMAYLTDGFVPEWFVKEKPRGTALAKRLVGAGLWHQGINDEGEAGFWFHDWKKECTKEHVLAQRENARLRKVKSRESHQESRVTDEVTHACVPSTTQPNPTQPIQKNSGCEPTELTLGSPTNRTRGTRLPDGWCPSPDVVAQMRSDHPQVQLEAEHAKFADYWHAKAGRDARKADWNATWRNWIRRAAEQTPRNGHTPANNGKPHKLRVIAELAAETRAAEQAQLESTRQQGALE